MSDVSDPATVSSVSDSATESSQNPGGTQLAGELTSVQQAALRELGNGHTISDAARTAGVDRRTVSRWIHHDPKFAAAYNAWCRELLDSGRARAIAMSDAALATVANAIQSGHVGAALQVVRNLGLIQAPRIGPTDPDVLERRAALRQVRSEERLHNAEEQYGLHKPIEQIETIEEIDEVIAPWIDLRDEFVQSLERDWQEHDEHLRMGRPCTPPDQPRPTLEEYAATVHRLSKKHNWDADSFISMSRDCRARTQEILQQRAQADLKATAPAPAHPSRQITDGSAASLQADRDHRDHGHPRASNNASTDPFVTGEDD